MNLLHGKTPTPRKVLFYGTKGIGKSTWANAWPSALFINIEDGLDNIDCIKTPWLTTYDDIINAIGWLISNPQPNETIVVDSADWMESLIFKKVAADAGKASIDLIGYNKGYIAAADELSNILRGLNKIRIEQKKHIVFLAHECAIKIKQPGIDIYEQYSPALHTETKAVLTEWVDDELFANYKTFVKKEDIGFEKTRSIGIGGTQRVIVTRQSAAVEAKNRLDNVPDEISMDFSEYARYLPRLSFAAPQHPSPAGNIAGAIVDGHNVRNHEPEKVPA